MANVFISYQRMDEKQAEKLATEIRNAKHNVWFDLWEVEIGDSIIGKMEEGLSNASYLILCMSGKKVEAKWFTIEWQSALARQLGAQAIKILPVKISADGLIMPAILNDIKYADLSADWQKGMQQLLRVIKDTVKRNVLIAHAPEDEKLAEQVAGLLGVDGYDVTHLGTIFIGDSMIEKVSKLLSEKAPVLLLGTVKAIGSQWLHRLVNAARNRDGVKVFALQIEKNADMDQLALDIKYWRYWENYTKAIDELRAELKKCYPVVEKGNSCTDTEYTAMPPETSSIVYNNTNNSSGNIIMGNNSQTYYYNKE